MLIVGSTYFHVFCVRNFQEDGFLAGSSIYEAYVKSKFRYKIYLAMNDVTSMLYVSLVRQFETLLFYVVTSRIEALVSRHKFLNFCVEKVYRLLLQPTAYCRFHLCI